MMDWKSLLSTVAPRIGTAVGGPLGAMAVTAAAEALGQSDNTEASIKAALPDATPEQMLALKNAGNDFAAKMQEERAAGRRGAGGQVSDFLDSHTVQRRVANAQLIFDISLL